jgi:hypothetical protein
VRRRQFITLLGGAAATWPLAGRAQQAGKLRTIGFLGPSTMSVASERVAAFRQRLRELGWVEGQTVAIDYRWADGRTERFREIAADFGRSRRASGAIKLAEGRFRWGIGDYINIEVERVDELEHWQEATSAPRARGGRCRVSSLSPLRLVLVFRRSPELILVCIHGGFPGLFVLAG